MVLSQTCNTCVSFCNSKLHWNSQWFHENHHRCFTFENVLTNDQFATRSHTVLYAGCVSTVPQVTRTNAITFYMWKKQIKKVAKSRNFDSLQLCWNSNLLFVSTKCLNTSVVHTAAWSRSCITLLRRGVSAVVVNHTAFCIYWDLIRYLKNTNYASMFVAHASLKLIWIILFSAEA